MDFCILGLLLILPRSSYELKQAFAQSLGLFYSASLGSLQTTLQKLVDRGLAELASEELQGRRKKTWQATEAGRDWFLATMLAPLPPGKLEESALARFHFLGLLDTQTERRKVLGLIVEAIEQALRSLEAQRQELNASALPESWRQIARYQFATLDYGIQAHRQGLAWFRERLIAEHG